MAIADANNPVKTLRRVAKAVYVALKPPRAGLEKVEYVSPTLGETTGDNAYTIVHAGREYKLFFLCGHPRSGTNWSGAVLNRHPLVNCQGEYRFEDLARGFRNLWRYDWHTCCREPMRSVARQCMHDSIRRIMLSSSSTKPGATWLGDRTPRGLDVFLPGAPHFLIIRDGRDVLISSTHIELRESLFNFSLPQFKKALTPLRDEFLADPNLFKKQPERLLAHEGWVRHMTRKWVRHVEHDLAALAGVEAGRIDARVHVIRYERIHEDPEGEREKMYRFLGLDPAQAQPLSEETRTKPGFKEENPDKFFRKGRAGDWPTYFHDDAKRWFKDEAGELLVRLGYEADLKW